MFGPRFDDALAYAANVHRAQTRKLGPPNAAGTAPPGIPYIGHLLGVASIVIDNAGSEDEAIAALLHDAPEDQGGQKRLEEIRARFGDAVADVVGSCSDALTEDPAAKPPWRARKERYIEHLGACADPSVHLVSAADKLHNARSTARDLELAADPKTVWAKFNPAAGRDGTLWYYRALIDAYRGGPPDERRTSIVAELAAVVDRMDLHSRSPLPP